MSWKVADLKLYGPCFAMFFPYWLFLPVPFFLALINVWMLDMHANAHVYTGSHTVCSLSFIMPLLLWVLSPSLYLSLSLSLSHTHTHSLSPLSLSISLFSLCCVFLSVAAVFTVPLTPTFCLLCCDFSLSYLYNIYIYLSTLLQFLDIFLLSTLPFHLVLSMTILRFAERHWSKKYATCFLMPLLWELCWCAVKFWLRCLSA